MSGMSLLKQCGRSFLSGADFILALTSLASAVSALRWQRPAEPCVWISNPLGSGEWTSVAWNLALTILLGASSLLVLMRKPFHRLRAARRAVQVALMVVALRVMFDVGVFFRLVATGQIVSSCPIPLSLWVLAVIAADIWFIRSVAAEPQSEARNRLARCLALVCLAIGQVAMIGLHVLTFGSTDYRRDADVAVVLGARVHPDGTLSLALSDRLDTAVDLFRESRVRFVLVSGATGLEGVNEAIAMRRYLLEAGLPENVILVDPKGANTLATARNTRRLMAEQGLASALIVSHYFHLARCKLLFEEQGLTAFTVPAHMSRRLVLEPYYVAREFVAYLWYALTRPLRPVANTK